MITHEYEHLQEHLIKNEESKILEGIAKTRKLTKEEIDSSELRYLWSFYNDIVISSFKKMSESDEYKRLIKDLDYRVKAIEYAIDIKNSPQNQRKSRMNSYESSNPGIIPYIEKELLSDIRTLDAKKDRISELRKYISNLNNEKMPVLEMPDHFYNLYLGLNELQSEELFKDYKVYQEQTKITFESTTNLPDIYGFSIEPRARIRYYEVSSTFAEIPLQKRKQIIDSGNDVFRQLAQISFDAGKMKAEDYKYLMGQEHCAKPDCCDRKCVIYKLLCKGAC